MKAGKLDHLIIVEQNTPTRDAFGGLVDSWDTYATVWAAIMPMVGTEALRADQLNTSITHKITIRYLESLSTQMRVNFSGRLMNIKSVQHIRERGDMMVLMCEELPDGNRS